MAKKAAKKTAKKSASKSASRSSSKSGGVAAAVAKAAALIQNAYDTGTPVPPIRTLLPEGDIDAAYAVQEINTRLRIKRGARLTGRKIGLTSKTIQKQLGVDRPDFGVLLDTMAISDGDVESPSSSCAHRTRPGMSRSPSIPQASAYSTS